MSLEKWVEYGWLRQEPTSPNEIKDLLDAEYQTPRWINYERSVRDWKKY